MTRTTASALAVTAIAALGVVAALLRQPRRPLGTDEPVSAATQAVAVETAPPPLPPSALAPSPTPAIAPALATADEATLMARLRGLGPSSAALAVDLAREGNRRFPDSPDAAERTAILIHALAQQGLASEARGEAEDMVNRYPDGVWVQQVESFTGAHRHRDVHLEPDGALRFE